MQKSLVLVIALFALGVRPAVAQTATPAPAAARPEAKRAAAAVAATPAARTRTVRVPMSTPLPVKPEADSGRTEDDVRSRRFRTPQEGDARTRRGCIAPVATAGFRLDAARPPALAPLPPVDEPALWRRRPIHRSRPKRNLADVATRETGSRRVRAGRRGEDAGRSAEGGDGITSNAASPRRDAVPGAEDWQDPSHGRSEEHSATGER